ncbi:MAG: glutamine-hydrolyzing carbamoyl-phosphate synthase small subunit [Candidatus Omnitrophica bacterium]|nr:glutamine-hydrolyzing carbamoyl-phosphate synthase small subunit [Candidatus Omnitrophota bacterium]
MEGYLVIEDGSVYKGETFGATGEAYGELIFNTSMTGYQEILYDPSYKGQIVIMTYPLIGNYGVNYKDRESSRIHLEGFVVRERSKIYSNWRATKPLDILLYEHGVIGIEGIDTRDITIKLRDQGTMKGGIFTGKNSLKKMIEKVKNSHSIVGVDLVRYVIKEKPYFWCDRGKYKVIVLDCGVKYNILRLLAERDMKVIVMPATVPWEEIEKEKPDGILVSNGPGDPAAVPYIVKTLSNLIEKYPMFGICFGIQLIAQVLGGRTYKLKFGHHGANHPVKDIKTGKVYITVQNHGFCVDINTLRENEVEITHINLNDNTLEGIAHKKLPVFAVQFHPENAPGPLDAVYLFDRFKDLVEKEAGV